MPLSMTINGQARVFGNLTEGAPLDKVIEQMQLKADRIAVEHNGIIAPRSIWSTLQIDAGDRLEIVHFVGGGLPRFY
jgi:sulfur carrier protein